MTNLPSIALLVPCFNAARHLPQLLEAAQQQTVPFAEIICYDDGSSDDTPEIAAKLGASVLRGGRNRGVAVARNRLLEAARSDWVHYHDVDDCLAPNFVEVMSEHAAQLQTNNGNSVVLICGINVERAPDPQKPDKIARAEPSQTFCALNTTDDPVAFLLKHFVHLNTALFPARLLREVGGFCAYLRINEDVDMMVRLAAHGAKFRAISDTLVTRVKHADSLTKRTQKARHYRYTLHYVNRCFKRLPPKYRPLIGEKALFYARFFYFEGLLVDARRALRLARRCGVRVAQNAPLSQRIIATVLGPERLFWLLRLYARRGSQSQAESGSEHP